MILGAAILAYAAYTSAIIASIYGGAAPNEAANAVCRKVEGRTTFEKGELPEMVVAYCGRGSKTVARIDVYPSPIQNGNLLQPGRSRIMVYRFNEPNSRFHPPRHQEERPVDADMIWPAQDHAGASPPQERCEPMGGRFARYDLCYHGERYPLDEDPIPNELQSLH